MRGRVWEVLFSVSRPRETYLLMVVYGIMLLPTQSRVGFLGDLTTSIIYDWNLLFYFTSLALVGIFIGIKISKFIEGKKLKPIFVWFVLVMGVYIISKELIFK